MEPKVTPKYKLQDLIDMAHFQNLQDRLNEIYSFPSAIIDNDGNILTATAWQDICTQFYRRNREGEKECIKSDRYIISHLHEANPAVSYKCPHGLVDNATPIIIDGVHYGNFFTGQFFLEKPDMNFYREQATKYGFDENAFIAAVNKVPVWTAEQLNSYLFFIKGLIVIISESALKNLKEIEARKQIELSEKRMGAVIRTTKDGFWVVSGDGRLLDANEAYSTMTGYSIEELLQLHISDLDATESPHDVTARIQQLMAEGTGLFETQHRRKNGSVFDVEVSVTYLPAENAQFICFCRDITARKVAEEALRESEEKYRALVDGINVGIIVAQDGVIKFVNRRATEFMGYSDREITAKPFIEFVHPDDREMVIENYKKRMKGEIVSPKYEIRLLPLDGTVRWVEISGSFITWEGKPASLNFLIDISERKKAEEALQESEARFKLLVENAPDGIFVQTQYRFAYLNTAAIKLLGAESTDQLLGRPVMERFDPQFHDLVKKRIRLLNEGKASVPVLEQIYLKMDGSPLKVEVSAVPIQWQGDNGGLVFFHDITERKQAEEAVAAEKERLAVTLRSIGDGVITTDTSGNIVIMNKVAEALTGWKQGEAQGMPLAKVFNIINQSTRLPHENPVAKVLSTGQIIELANHTLLISRDGTERTIADSGAPIRDSKSVTIGVVLVFRDMTEKHKLIDNMLRIDKLDALGVLAGGIAHDFNNLLGGIFGYIDMARERTTTDKTVAKYLDKAITVFDRAKDLTQQLLTFSKGGTPKRKTGQLGKLVKENAAFVLSGTNVSCDYRIAQDLWLADYDENQIGQVIDNIVLNAQQAMPVGGTIVISVDNISLKDNEELSLKAGNYIKISITDTGVGIPQDLLKRIFDPFFTTKQKGNGLGLATCYSIVQKHDGFIDVESIPGKGSTFHIYLPATHKGTVQDVSQSRAQHKGTGGILVMDDEDFMRETVGDMLSMMGYTLIEAENGEEALRLCAEAKKRGDPIRGALFDLTIPGGMGGKETIVKLRKDFPDMPVFASSGFSEDPVMARPTEFGFTDSIRKPFKKNELAEMLERHLKNAT